jgi:ABC-2 type transport system ATP-binding protein
VTNVAEGPALTVEHLTFTYPNTASPQLEDVNLRLMAGAAAGVLGANGAGKSTLLRAITGTVAGATVGRVEVGIGGTTRDIGFATQDVALYPTLTVAENIEQSASLLLHRSAVASAIEGIINEFRLDHLADRPCHELSGGQRRLAHLAVSFVHAPAVRFLDEPTTALDFETRANLIKIVRRWVAEGIAIVVTAHYPEDIEDLCTELHLLGDHTLRRLGSLREVQGRGQPVIVVTGRTTAGEVEEITLPVPNDAIDVETLRDALPPGFALHSVEPRGTRLRDLLGDDPTLRSLLVEEPA